MIYCAKIRKIVNSEEHVFVSMVSETDGYMTFHVGPNTWSTNVLNEHGFEVVNYFPITKDLKMEHFAIEAEFLVKQRRLRL